MAFDIAAVLAFLAKNWLVIAFYGIIILLIIVIVVVLWWMFKQGYLFIEK